MKLCGVVATTGLNSKMERFSSEALTAMGAQLEGKQVRIEFDRTRGAGVVRHAATDGDAVRAEIFISQAAANYVQNLDGPLFLAPEGIVTKSHREPIQPVEQYAGPLGFVLVIDAVELTGVSLVRHPSHDGVSPVTRVPA